MKKRMFIPVLFVYAISLSAVSAAPLQELGARMRARAVQIGRLKVEKRVGENNRGYLEVLVGVTLDPASTKLVTDENADRRAVYTIIAEQQQTTADMVGRNRAVMIAKRAERGIMIQRADGTWVETK